MQPIVHGSLQGFEPVKLIRFLAEGPRPGALLCSLDGTSVTLWLGNGSLIFARRQTDGADPDIAALLLQRGATTKEIQLFHGLRDGGMGDLLGSPELSEAFPHSRLAEWSRWIAEEALVDLLLQPEGEFSFVPDHPLPEGALAAETSLDELFESLHQRLKGERERIEQSVFRAVAPGGEQLLRISARSLRLLLSFDGQQQLSRIADDDMDWLVARDLNRRGLTELVAVAEVPLGEAVADSVADAEEPVAEEGAPASAAPAPAFSDSFSINLACLTLEDAVRTSFPLFGERATIGRETDNQVIIADKSVSGSHAVITRTTSGYELEDLGSRNGTFVNGEKIEKKLLQDQDMIRFGTVYAIFSLPSQLEQSMATMYETPNPSR
jgi:hypothetical protein